MSAVTSSLTPEGAPLPRITLRQLAETLRQAHVSVACHGDEASAVLGMTVDSREVEAGNLFVCKGAAFNPSYLASAAKAGAAAYLCSESDYDELAAAAPHLPCLAVSDVRRAMALVAPEVYGHPERGLRIVGITGTKGKSTTAYMLRSIFEAAGMETSILGSIETDDGVEHYESHNTTPEAPELWRHLWHTARSGRPIMVMEVSSQGLKYDRVLGVPFEIAVFLNIGRDHISSIEHPNFEDYFASKLRIFDQCATAVVNLGSEHADRVLEASRAARRILTLSAIDKDAADALGGTIADVQAQHIVPNPTGCSFDVVVRGTMAAVSSDNSSAPYHASHIDLGIPGLFNVENALAAITCAQLLGVPEKAIRQGLAQLRVPGRMEVVASADRRVVAIIDYAHNELSYQALFSSVQKEYPGRRIVALFGAPGDKAIERREALPCIAGQYADLIIYTEEDPAHERVEDICAELASHTPAGVAHITICDREEAVAYAIHDAYAHNGESVVLLLAKGDETRQHRGDEYPEVKSDLALARELIK